MYGKNMSQKNEKHGFTGPGRTCGMAVLFLTVILGGNQVKACQLNGGNVSLTLGETTEITVPIDVVPGSGENVAALQFDLDYAKDQLIFDRVTVGAAAQQAEKAVAYNQVGSAGNSIRVVVYGMNRNTIGEGTVANIIFKVSLAAGAGTLALLIHETVACDPDVSPVTIASSPGAVTIQAPGVAGSLSGMKVYPNPYKPGAGHSRVIFLNIPADSHIKIHKLTGELVKEIKEQNQGMAEWDGKNQAGKEAASGVYLYSLTNKAGKKARGRIAVVR